MTQTKEQLLKQLADQNAQLKALNEAIKNTEIELTEFCPVKIGDVVEVNEWTYEGKPIKVDRITFLSYDSGYVCSGQIVKKNGELSESQRGRHHC